MIGPAADHLDPPATHDSRPLPPQPAVEGEVDAEIQQSRGSPGAVGPAIADISQAEGGLPKVLTRKAKLDEVLHLEEASGAKST